MERAEAGVRVKRTHHSHGQRKCPLANERLAFSESCKHPTGWRDNSLLAVASRDSLSEKTTARNCEVYQKKNSLDGEVKNRKPGQRKRT